MTTHANRLMPETHPADSFSAVHPSTVQPSPYTSNSDPSDGAPPNPRSSNPWFVIQTRYRFEIKVADHLRNKGIETFLPLLNETHRWSDRQKIVSVPLFSGYVFVRIQASAVSRTSVLHTEGVIGFVSVHGDVSPVPAGQIEDLRRLLNQKVPCALHAFLKVGQRVRIRGGCLNGLQGILARSTQKTLVISIDCIQRSLAVSIEGYELELA
jgi:transcription antitermination factor NusG